MYGAGIIENLEEKRIDGINQMYYVMRIPVGNLKIMLSVSKAQNAGIRRIMSAAPLLKTIDSVKEKPIIMDTNWNQRYKDNMEKIKTGDISEVAEVFRNLRQREREKGLSSAEKKMLSTVKQIILSEIILSNDVERPEAEEILDGIIF